MTGFSMKNVHRAMRVPTLLVIVFFVPQILLAGCTAARVQGRPPLDAQGALYLYLQPLPAAAARLAFTLERVAAVTEGGEEIPLSLRIDELSPRSVSRERLLATGELPPGRYAALAFKVRKASLMREEDNAALQSPEESVRVDIPFAVARKKARVLTLTFRYAESLTGGVLFNPRFTILPAAKVVKGLLGFVVNRGSNTVTVFDKVTGRVSDVIPTGAAPEGMVIDPSGWPRAYVAVSGEDVVEVIDLLQSEVIDRIRLTMGDRPLEVALTPDGKTLLTVNAGSNTVSFIDTVSRYEQARIPLPNGPRSILLDATGRRAYVFNTLGSSVSVIDVPNRGVAATITTESAPLRGQLNRRGDRLYVIHQWSPHLLVIDTSSLAVVRKQNVGLGFQALKVDPASDWIYMARRGGSDVEVLDPFTLMARRFLGAEGEVAFMTIDGQENSLFLLMPGKETLRIVDLIRYDPRVEIDVGVDPCWATVLGER